MLLKTTLDEVCRPHNVAPPLEQLHGVVSRTEQRRVPVPHTLHGRAFKDMMLLIELGTAKPSALQTRLNALPAPLLRCRGLLYKLLLQAASPPYLAADC